MKKSIIQRHLVPFIWLVTMHIGLAHAQSDHAMQSIDFQLASDHLGQFGFMPDATVISERVRTNLAEWSFPLKSGGAFTHGLQARLGRIARRETPVGFSFSAGNSDPRATEFQKADVLPVTCSLRDLGKRTVLIEREYTFSAHAMDKDVSSTHIVDKLVDVIGTACLDVLEHAPQMQTADRDRVRTEFFKPKWLPDVRIEVRELAVPAAPEGSPESRVIDEPKKEVIIHNHGNPVIFTFGHDRK